jgi:hypothetical protein
MTTDPHPIKCQDNNCIVEEPPEVDFVAVLTAQLRPTEHVRPVS